MRWCEGLVWWLSIFILSGLGLSGDLAPFIAHPPILISSQVTQAQQSTNKHNTTDSLTHHEIGAILNET